MFGFAAILVLLVMVLAAAYFANTGRQYRNQLPVQPDTRDDKENNNEYVQVALAFFMANYEMIDCTDAFDGTQSVEIRDKKHKTVAFVLVDEWHNGNQSVTMLNSGNQNNNQQNNKQNNNGNNQRNNKGNNNG